MTTKFFSRLLIAALIIFCTWLAFVIERAVVMALAPHWDAILEWANQESHSLRYRNLREALLFVGLLASALGIPILLSAIPGYALFRTEYQTKKRGISAVTLARILPIGLCTVFAGGILVVMGRGQNVDLQFLGGDIMLFGTVSLFAFAWAYIFMHPPKLRLRSLLFTNVRSGKRNE